jgi:hypothetical protein
MYVRMFAGRARHRLQTPELFAARPSCRDFRISFPFFAWRCRHSLSRPKRHQRAQPRPRPHSPRPLRSPHPNSRRQRHPRPLQQRHRPQSLRRQLHPRQRSQRRLPAPQRRRRPQLRRHRPRLHSPLQRPQNLPPRRAARCAGRPRPRWPIRTSLTSRTGRNRIVPTGAVDRSADSAAGVTSIARSTTPASPFRISKARSTAA